MTDRVPLQAQKSAVDTVIRVITGAAIKPKPSELSLLVSRLLAVDATLAWLQNNEAAIKAIDAARREAERQEKA